MNQLYFHKRNNGADTEKVSVPTEKHASLVESWSGKALLPHTEANSSIWRKKLIKSAVSKSCERILYVKKLEPGSHWNFKQDNYTKHMKKSAKVVFLE